MINHPLVLQRPLHMIRQMVWSVAGIFLLVFIFSINPLSFAAQIPLIDSLRRDVGAASSLQEKADIFHQLASEIWDYDFEKGFEYANESYQVAKRANYKKGMAVALNDMALYHYFKGDYLNAQRYFHLALRTAAGEHANYVASINIRLGNLYREQALFDSASFYYNKAFLLLDFKTPSVPLGQYYQNTGLMDYALARYSSARANFERALHVRLALTDSLAVGESWKTLGMVASAQAQFDSAQYYFNKIHRLAEDYHNPELRIFYNIYQGEVLFRKGDFVSATRMFTEALDSLAKHDYKRYRALVLKNIGQVFDWQGDYPRSLEFYFSALKIEEELRSRLEIARTKQMMGWVYVNQKEFAKATRLAAQASRIFRDVGDSFGLSEYYALAGYIAFNQKMYDVARRYYDSSLVIRERLGTLVPAANTLNFLAEVYIAQGNYDQAITMEKRVFDIDQRVNNRVGVATYYNSMSTIMKARGNYSDAEDFALKALFEANMIQSPPQRRKAYETLYTIYRTRGDYPKAIRFYENYIQLSDSMYTTQSAARQAELDALYRLEKREQEIEDLHQKNVLQEATLSQQHAQIRFQNTVGVFFILGIILLASLAYVLYRYSVAKSRANRELSGLYNEISIQKKEIQDQAAELRSANETLVQLNNELIEKTEEIEAQSEELRESNDTIVAMNHDLDNIVIKRTAQLKEAYKELDTFFYRSSHDFRRPLTTFMGLAEVAKVTVKDQAALDLFEKVKETAKSLDKMLVKLQSISDVGARELVYKEVLVKEIFDSICHSFEEEITRKGFRIESDINLRDTFISYPAMVKVILENLVENAIQFCAMEHPYIRLSCFQEGSNVCLVLEDNGQGIPFELRDRVFDMYFRGSERSKGNGLGLYIVKKAVEKLNGTIQVETNLHIGSVFTVILPIQDASRW